MRIFGSFRVSIESEKHLIDLYADDLTLMVERNSDREVKNRIEILFSNFDKFSLFSGIKIIVEKNSILPVARWCTRPLIIIEEYKVVESVKIFRIELERNQPSLFNIGRVNSQAHKSLNILFDKRYGTTLKIPRSQLGDRLVLLSNILPRT
uniref:Uncharacterized protein n=1 Tax=Lepeophtheirus salmonis TaxID=72036 RepID=A0A0K2UW42_LEPSM